MITIPTMEEKVPEQQTAIASMTQQISHCESREPRAEQLCALWRGLLPQTALQSLRFQVSAAVSGPCSGFKRHTTPQLHLLSVGAGMFRCQVDIRQVLQRYIHQAGDARRILDNHFEQATRVCGQRSLFSQRPNGEALFCAYSFSNAAAKPRLLMNTRVETVQLLYASLMLQPSPAS